MKSVIETLRNLKANEAEVAAEDEAAKPKTSSFEATVRVKGLIKFSVDAASEDEAHKKADQMVSAHERDLTSLQKLGDLDLEVVDIDVR